MKKINQTQKNTRRKIQKVKIHKKKEKISIINQQSDSLGQILEKLKNQEKNLKKQRKSLNSNLNSEKLLINKGLSLMCKGKFEESINQFDEAIKLNPKNDEAYTLHYNQIDQTQNQLNQTNSKKVYKQQIQQLNQTRKMTKLIIKKARLYFILINKKKQSLNFKKQLVQTQKMNLHNLIWVLFIVMQANLLREWDRHTEAIEYYNRAIQINPTDIEYYIEKAFCLQVLKKYKNAIECFNQALSLNPDEELTQTLLMNKAFSLGCIQQFEEELDCYQKVVKVNPKHKEAQQLIKIFSIQINNCKKANDNGTQKNKKQKIRQLENKKN